MAKQVFINLCVKDLSASKKFFEAMGFTFNPQFTDENAACLVIEDGYSYAMLLTQPHFKRFTNKEIIDAAKSVEVLNAISLDSKDQVDTVANAGLANGGSEAKPTEDTGWMYTRAIQDPDGHVREFFHMDMSNIPQQA